MNNDQRAAWNFCLAFPDKLRPCIACAGFGYADVRFSNGEYTFWRAAVGDKEIWFRTRPGQSAEERLQLLRNELPDEISRKRAENESRREKYGPRWAMVDLALTGRWENKFAKMLEVAANPQRELRLACACEVAFWLSTHENDAHNVTENLNAEWAPFFVK